MIFEINPVYFQKKLSFLLGLLTGTEAKKEKFIEVELCVEGERVWVFYTGNEDVDFSYQIELAEAKGILDGQVRVDMKELSTVLKYFDKKTSSVVIERDEMELHVDDGVYEPELIVLDDRCDEVFGRPAQNPENTMFIPKKWLEKSFELASLNSRASFLSATSMIGIVINEESLFVRSFYFTNLYEGKFTLSSPLNSTCLLFNKGMVSRLLKILKGMKVEQLSFFIERDNFMIMADGMMFCFRCEQDEQSKQILSSIQTNSLSMKEDLGPISLSEINKELTVKKGEESPISVSFSKQGDNIRIESFYTIQTGTYPHKFIQKASTKWDGTVRCVIGEDVDKSALWFMEGNHDEYHHLVVMPFD